MSWFTIATHGYQDVATGPWKTRSEAEAAILNAEERMCANPSKYLFSRDCVRIQEYRTRAAARHADIGTNIGECGRIG